MKTSIILFIFLLLHFTAWAQDCELIMREFINELSYELDTTDTETYESILIEQKMIPITKKSEDYFLKDYPNIFVKEGLCYYFKTKYGEELKACAIDTASDSKDNHQYEFKGQYCNKSLIFISGYESWGYLSVDLLDGTVFSTMGSPKTSDCKLIYSYSQYYGEEEITIVDVIAKKQLVLIIDSWYTEESKQEANKIFLKMKSTNCPEKVKHIKITVN